MEIRIRGITLKNPLYKNPPHNTRHFELWGGVLMRYSGTGFLGTYKNPPRPPIILDIFELWGGGGVFQSNTPDSWGEFALGQATPLMFLSSMAMAYNEWHRSQCLCFCFFNVKKTVD